MTLPNLSFSLSPITFLRASPSQAGFFNNITWSGSAQFRRSISDFPDQPDTAAFNRSQADRTRTNAGVNSSLNLGNLSLSGSADFSENVLGGVPVGMPLIGTLGPEDPFGRRDESTADASWSASLGYQQRLIGSTTLTPSLSVSSQLKRSNTDSLATSFVSGPTRMSLGVSLRTDIYGFFPGFGPFEAIRHKISPGFDFSYAPEVSPTELQREVFGASEVGAQRTLRISLNQTFEAKPREDAAADSSDSASVPGETSPEPTDSIFEFPGDTLGFPQDSLPPDSVRTDSLRRGSGQGPDRKFTLLALKTTAISYDFEEAKRRGDWLWGVKSTVLTNTISSDYFRGLNITVAHDLFDDSGASAGEGGEGSGRKFSPHLSSLNFGFSVNAQSFPFRQISQLLGGGAGAEDLPSQTAAVAGEEAAEDPFSPSLTDESSIVPTGADPSARRRTRSGVGGGGAGSWQANLRFSMQRPREAGGRENQMLQGDLRFSLTEKWDVSWRTSYDLLLGTFNDHFITLTRDLHRWEAHFDFRQTATGNWSFRFEVALTDQEDLHFDYSQRSYQDRTGVRRY
jgi:hypothetical protein